MGRRSALRNVAEPMSSQPQHFPDPIDAGRPPDHPACSTHGAFCIDGAAGPGQDRRGCDPVRRARLQRLRLRNGHPYRNRRQSTYAARPTACAPKTLGSANPARAGSSWDRARRPCERIRCRARFSCRCQSTSRFRPGFESQFPTPLRSRFRGSGDSAHRDHCP